jgi:hypothetical protein
MERSSKYNPYECPECGYKSTRKWNMTVHLERVHGLAPFLPERSKKDWVFAQLHTLAQRFAEAKLAGDKDRQEHHFQSLISLWSYHRGLFPIEYISQVAFEKTEELEKQVKRQQKL